MMSCAGNKDKSTVEFVLNAARVLLDKKDLDSVLKFNDENWLAETLCQFSLLSESKSFDIFWSFLEDNLERDDLKKLFLQKNSEEQIALQCSVYNKHKSTIKRVINITSSLYLTILTLLSLWVKSGRLKHSLCSLLLLMHQPLKISGLF